MIEEVKMVTKGIYLKRHSELFLYYMNLRKSHSVQNGLVVFQKVKLNPMFHQSHS